MSNKISNISIFGGIALAVLILFGIAKQSNECDRKGGVLMKTMYNTYECVHKK